LQNFIKNNLCKISRRRYRDRNPSRPRLQKTSLETRLETETKSRDSITVCVSRELAAMWQKSIERAPLAQKIMS